MITRAINDNISLLRFLQLNINARVSFTSYIALMFLERFFFTKEKIKRLMFKQKQKKQLETTTAAIYLN